MDNLYNQGQNGAASEAVNNQNSSSATNSGRRETQTASGTVSGKNPAPSATGRCENTSSLSSYEEKSTSNTSDTAASVSKGTSSTTHAMASAGTKRKFEREDNQQEHIERRADGRRLVKRGSLNEAELIKAMRQVRSSRDKDSMTEDEKLEERRTANRLSAFQSRKRRLAVIDDLQKTVAQLSKDNSEQRTEIEKLKLNSQLLQQENHALRSQLLVVCGGATTSLLGPPTTTTTAASLTNNGSAFTFRGEAMSSRLPGQQKPETGQNNNVMAMLQEKIDEIKNNQARSLLQYNERVTGVSNNSAFGNHVPLQRQHEALWPLSTPQPQPQQQHHQQQVTGTTAVSQQLLQQLSMLIGLNQQEQQDHGTKYKQG